MTYDNNNQYTIETLKRILTIFLFVCAGLECLCFPEVENIYGSFTMIYGWLLISKTVLKYENLLSFFIPFVCLFCYAISLFILPLPITLIEGKPITFRFNVPYITFTNIIFNVTTIVAAFYFCKKIYNKRLLTPIWQKLGYFKVPSSTQLWMLGFVGCLALLFNLSLQGTDMMDSENRGAFGQLVGQITIYSIAPIALLFSKYYGGNSIGFAKRPLVFYICFLVLLAVASTRRELLFDATVAWGVMTIMIYLIENKKLFSTKINIGIVVGFYLVTGPVTDMATAMIIMRSDVYGSSSSSTFSKVMELYNDKEALHNAYQLATFANTDNKGDNFAAWSEYYVDNIIMDRICNLRVQDLTLDYVDKMNAYGSPLMQEYMENFIVFQIPTPILRLLGYTANKFENHYTPGDLISTEAFHLKHQYRGFRIAGDCGVGLYWLGYWYYPVAFLVLVCVFYFFSSLTIFNAQRLIIPVPVIMTIVDYFWYFNNSTGICRSVSLLLRTGVQSIILYCITMMLLRMFFKIK